MVLPGFGQPRPKPSGAAASSAAGAAAPADAKPAEADTKGASAANVVRSTAALAVLQCRVVLTGALQTASAGSAGAAAPMTHVIKSRPAAPHKKAAKAKPFVLTEGAARRVSLVSTEPHISTPAVTPAEGAKAAESIGKPAEADSTKA